MVVSSKKHKDLSDIEKLSENDDVTLIGDPFIDGISEEDRNLVSIGLVVEVEGNHYRVNGFNLAGGNYRVTHMVELEGLDKWTSTKSMHTAVFIKRLRDGRIPICYREKE